MFEASLGKQFTRPYLKKPSQKKAGGVNEGVALSLDPSITKEKKKKKRNQTIVTQGYSAYNSKAPKLIWVRSLSVCTPSLSESVCLSPGPLPVHMTLSNHVPTRTELLAMGPCAHHTGNASL
jgi:hypothetical protein